MNHLEHLNNVCNDLKGFDTNNITDSNYKWSFQMHLNSNFLKKRESAYIPSTVVEVFDRSGHFTYVDNKSFEVKQVYIKRIIYRNPATIVFWSDGTKTVSKCFKGEEYSAEMGLLVCILKKEHSRGKLTELLKYWVPKDVNFEPNVTKSVTVKEVRKMELKK